MESFKAAYRQLNERQREAVDTIDGPVLVVAGPGTGKTQLLSVRVANILDKTDATPGNVLCLTFTDNAARNMRERLVEIVGQPGYHVAIYTFHSFGSDVINQFPDCFSGRQMIQQIDELGRYELLHQLFEDMPHSNPLSVKVGEDFLYLKDTMNIISWLKQNALAPHELHELLSANEEFIKNIEGDLSETFAETPAAKYLPKYKRLLDAINDQASGKRYWGFPEYATECATELELAINETDPQGRYAKPITAWRSRWCQKNAAGRHILKDGGQNYRKMHAVANVYDKLLKAMAEQGLYDFDDMVVEVVQAMEKNNELRFNLQERYQYILVDEFQDTNKAQLRMLTALGSNLVHENRPNIMAVGDDDQAIYAFQGAEVSNMVAFAGMYSRPKLIALEENYRSNTNILEASSSLAGQITDRLEAMIPDTSKRLVAKTSYGTNVMDYLSFVSELAQYDWIAEEITHLIASGTKPEQIAVIAPRHKYLERLMPYLGNRKLPVAYERRENILDAPLIRQLLKMGEVVVALNNNNQDEIDSLLAEVLSYDFWGIPSDTIIDISIRSYKAHAHWLETIHRSKHAHVKSITDWFVELARHSTLEPMEYLLDQLMGVKEGATDSEYEEIELPKRPSSKFVSPMHEYYFNETRYEQAADLYLTLLGQLSTLRHRLRLWKPNRTLYIQDLVEFNILHRQANLKVVDTNPHTQTVNAVQVMTAYKAKGLEFDVVFVINAQDEVWGPTAKSGSSKIALPKNLPIQPAGEQDNDRLRLLFVALTRAKHTLHITGYAQNQENKLSPGLSFLLDTNDPTAPIYPDLAQKAIDKPETAQAVEILGTDWAYRYRQIIADKKTLFEPILAEYKLSVTHMNNFIDVREHGPNYFFARNLLRFPQAASPSAAYGDAVHKTLQWVYSDLRANSKLPSTKVTLEYFVDMLKRKHLRQTDYKRLETRGLEAIEVYLAERSDDIFIHDMVERGFNNDGVVILGAQLSGKIDKLRITEPGRADVIDFKTGKPARNWQGKDEHEKIKLHKYRQQLMFYKLLVENSASFSKKLTVVRGALEFVERDENDKLVENLQIDYDLAELESFTKLIAAVWQHIQDLNFPDVSDYPHNLTGIQSFEQDLIDGKI